LGKKLKSPQTLPGFFPDLIMKDISKEVKFDTAFDGITNDD